MWLETCNTRKVPLPYVQTSCLHASVLCWVKVWHTNPPVRDQKGWCFGLKYPRQSPQTWRSAAEPSSRSPSRHHRLLHLWWEELSSWTSPHYLSCVSMFDAFCRNVDMKRILTCLKILPTFYSASCCRSQPKCQKTRFHWKEDVFQMYPRSCFHGRTEVEIHNSVTNNSVSPGEHAKTPTKSVPLSSVEDLQAHS